VPVVLCRSHLPDMDDVDMKPSITPREEQLLSLVRRGMTNAEIARRLDVREQTVKNALAVLFQKYHVRNRTQLAMTEPEAAGGTSRRSG
jgi:DNA-binding NarL/FixJ family response regulator